MCLVTIGTGVRAPRRGSSVRALVLCAGAALGVFVVASASSARAGVIIYGHDPAVRSRDPRPESESAAASFRQAAAARGQLIVNDVEGVEDETLAPFDLDAHVTVDAVWQGLGSHINIYPWVDSLDDSASGGFATSGRKMIQAALEPPAALTFSFTPAAQAFGAFFTGVGTAHVPGNSLTVTIDDGGVTRQEIVPGDVQGGVQFWGILPRAGSSGIRSLSITSGDYFDYFGIDDVTYSIVPAPGAVGLLALAGVRAARRSRRR